MKPIRLLAMFGCLAATTLPSLGQIAGEFPLYSTDNRTSEGPPEEVVYRPRNLDDRGFNRVVQAIAVPTLTVYRPDTPRPDRAALVICPGGGYRYVVIDREGHFLARYFRQQGFTVAVLKYRLPDPAATGDGLPYSQQDALEAIRFVRRHAAEWGVNPDKVGIMGASAGGHLAASIGILGRREDSSRPDFVALLYPVISLEEPHVHSGSRDRLLGEGASAERIAAWSLNHHVRASMPPYFLVHARNDTAVPLSNSEIMAEALQKAGVPAKLMVVGRGGHGFALGRDAESSAWPAEFVSWVDGLAALAQ